MTCDERQDLIPLYSLGALDPAERDALRRHLEEGCPACQAALSETRALGALLAMSLEPAAPPAPVRKRIMRRVMESAELSPPAISSLRRPSLGDWARPFLAAAAAVAVVLILDRIYFKSHSIPLERRLAQLESQLAEMQSTQRRTEQLIDFHSPQVQFVQLKGTPDAPHAMADVRWDRSRGVWYLHTTGLPPSAPGRAYELWYITGETKTRAGVFEVTSTGEGSLVAAIPRGLGKITLAAITDEPAAGSDQPTGKIRVAGVVVD